LRAVAAESTEKDGIPGCLRLAGIVVASWLRQPIHFIDFEGSLGSGILEYGVVTLESGLITGARTRLCRATGAIRSEDIEVHGLAARDVAASPPFADDFEFFAGLRETGPLAAHFAHAENTLIKSVWPYPRTSPDFSRDGANLTEWGPWIDTGRLYPQFYPTLDSAKLEQVVSVFGLQASLDEAAARWCPLERRRYHAALYDALAGALLLLRLGTEPALRERPLAWILAHSTLDPDKRDAINQGRLFE
jgi:DNA polymerase III epsilon subunit-like protein